MTPLQQRQAECWRAEAVTSALRARFLAAVLAQHERGRPLEDIGRELDLSRQRVFQLVNAARDALSA